jgi:hypothetical protein
LADATKEGFFAVGAMEPTLYAHKPSRPKLICSSADGTAFDPGVIAASYYEAQGGLAAKKCSTLTNEHQAR